MFINCGNKCKYFWLTAVFITFSLVRCIFIRLRNCCLRQQHLSVASVMHTVISLRHAPVPGSSNDTSCQRDDCILRCPLPLCHLCLRGRVAEWQRHLALVKSLSLRVESDKQKNAQYSLRLLQEYDLLRSALFATGNYSAKLAIKSLRGEKEFRIFLTNVVLWSAIKKASLFI